MLMRCIRLGSNSAAGFLKTYIYIYILPHVQLVMQSNAEPSVRLRHTWKQLSPLIQHQQKKSGPITKSISKTIILLSFGLQGRSRSQGKLKHKYGAPSLAERNATWRTGKQKSALLIRLLLKTISAEANDKFAVGGRTC